jgi:hypothetical protein
MQINLGQKKEEGERPVVSERSGVIKPGSTYIGPLKREREMLDSNGNTIDPVTKRIIKAVEVS